MAKQNLLTQAQRDFAITRLRELLIEGQWTPEHLRHKHCGKYSESELYALAKDRKNLVSAGETQVKEHTRIDNYHLKVDIERVEVTPYKFKPAVIAKLDAAYEKRKAAMDAKIEKYKELEAVVMLGDAAALMTVITDAQAFLKTLKS